jgi:hypothetical protein
VTTSTQCAGALHTNLDVDAERKKEACSVTRGWRAMLVNQSGDTEARNGTAGSQSIGRCAAMSTDGPAVRRKRAFALFGK